MDADLDTLGTALYVRVDDLWKASPDRAPSRPLVGITPRITDAELLTLAVMQALLGFTSQARWLRHARHRFAVLFCLSATSAGLPQADAGVGGHDELI